MKRRFARQCSGVNLSHAAACVSEELSTKAYAVASADRQGQAIFESYCLGSEVAHIIQIDQIALMNLGKTVGEHPCYFAELEVGSDLVSITLVFCRQ